MTDHRVLSHLGVAAREYDVAIRRYIPRYEEMIATAVSLARGDVIDLGSGTGALAAAILEAQPSARVKLVDIDPAMLETARERVAHHGDRAELVHASFDTLWSNAPRCDTVVASLALHHVPEIEKKRTLYARIYEALRPGGAVIVADCNVHEHGRERDQMFATWSAWMAQHGIAQPEANDLFAKWAGEDRYYPIAVELHLLADAGFARPDVFWKYGPISVYGAFRD
ncbi:MAG TPA: class I SAM-dependent methyltransferase [Kofleriaceae bacterium]|nr:class I SAM-dependent methyltransferase [Kofleriaceae bacterium]